MKSNWILGLAATAIASAALVGCGNDAESNPPPDPNAAAMQKAADAQMQQAASIQAAEQKKLEALEAQRKAGATAAPKK